MTLKQGIWGVFLIILFKSMSAGALVPIVGYDQLPLTLDGIASISAQKVIQTATLATGVDTGLGLGTAGTMSGNGVLGSTGLTTGGGSATDSLSSAGSSAKDAAGW